MKRLKENDYLYSSARIRALERTLLTRDRIERMLDSKTASEAAKVLSECGYEDIPSITRESLETMLSKERSRVYSLLRSFVPHREIIDFFRVKYDYHNLKAIVKAEAQDIDEDRLVVSDGRFAKPALINAVRKADYSGIPAEMGHAIESAKDILSRTGDPQLSDIEFDRACFGEMLSIAQSLGSVFLTGYVRLLIDIANIRIIVRSVRTKRDFEFLRRSLLEGGNIEAEQLLAAISDMSLKTVFRGSILEPAASIADNIISGLEKASGLDNEFGRSAPDGDRASMTELERILDGAADSYLDSAKKVTFGEAPVITFLAAKETEYTTVRAILSGLLAGVSPGAIRQRLSLTAV